MTEQWTLQAKVFVTMPLMSELNSRMFNGVQPFARAGALVGAESMAAVLPIFLPFRCIHTLQIHGPFCNLGYDY